MKTTYSIAISFGLLFGLASTGVAQKSNPNSVKEKKHREKRQKLDVKQFLNRFDRNEDNNIQKSELPDRLSDHFDKLDRNDDGKLSRKELRKHAFRMNAMADQGQHAYLFIYRSVRDPLTRKDLQDAYTMLRMIDEDEDGKLTAEELKDAQKRIREKHAQSIFNEWDRNNDDKLSRKEVNPYMLERFDSIDRNDDDSISFEEMEQAFQARRTQTSAKN